MENDLQQIKQIQAASLEIFKEFIAVCQKLNVRYYLLAGTLLGAVRHQGFIPWDDDIDVGMPRADYEVFLAQAQELLPKHLFVQSFRTDPEYPQAFAKVRNSDTAFIERSVCDRKMNHGVFIDIFPLDTHENKKITCLMQLKRKMIALRISYACGAEYVSKKVRLVRPISKLFYSSVHAALEARDEIYRSIPEGTMLANYSSLWGEKEIVPVEWYGEGCELMFEGLCAIGPKEYDKWLTQVYGDYLKLPPVEKRVTHHHTKVIDTQNSYKKYMDLE